MFDNASLIAGIIMLLLIGTVVVVFVWIYWWAFSLVVSWLAMTFFKVEVPFWVLVAGFILFTALCGGISVKLKR